MPEPDRNVGISLRSEQPNIRLVGTLGSVFSMTDDFTSLQGKPVRLSFVNWTGGSSHTWKSSISNLYCNCSNNQPRTRTSIIQLVDSKMYLLNEIHSSILPSTHLLNEQPTCLPSDSLIQPSTQATHPHSSHGLSFPLHIVCTLVPERLLLVISHSINGFCD